MLECYDNIIGLSRRECPCFATGRPQDYNESKSGIYLDELTSLSALNALRECDSTVWDMLKEARELAIKQFIADSNGKLGMTYQMRRKPFVGVLGSTRENSTYTITKPFAVLRLAPAAVRSGYIKLVAINTLYSATGSITVDLYDSVNGYRDSYELATTANRLNRSVINVELEMYSKYDKKLEYFLVIHRDADNKPKDTTADCGCGNNYTFDKANPYTYRLGTHNDNIWADWLMAGGSMIDNVSDLDFMKDTATNKTYGLALEIETKCKVSEVLCKDSLDFEANPSALSLAMAINYMAGVFAIDKILKSDLLTRDTMINTDQLIAGKTEYEQKYNEHLTYIVQNAVITGNDCLTCKDVYGLTRTGLFA